jgi:hypothetical protein
MRQIQQSECLLIAVKIKYLTNQLYIHKTDYDLFLKIVPSWRPHLDLCTIGILRLFKISQILTYDRNFKTVLEFSENFSVLAFTS